MWLAVGDQNTSFFHRVTQTRASRNTIRQLTVDSGETFTSPADIKREAVLHFQRFLQTGTATPDSLQDFLSYRCPPSVMAFLIAPITAADVKQALLSLPNDKVSGPDGYSNEFYVAAWPILGADFVTAVQSFFLFGFMSRGVNATILSLIPKHENSLTMKDYQPIVMWLGLVLQTDKFITQPNELQVHSCVVVGVEHKEE